MRRTIVTLTVTAALFAVAAPTAVAAHPHFVGARSCTFSTSTGDLTCSFKVAGLGDATEATILLVFPFGCTNRGGHNPPGQASTNPVTVPVRNGQITLTNFTFSTNASCPDRMAAFAGPFATLFVNGVEIGQIPIATTA